MPARNETVLKKHNDVHIDKTFLPKIEEKIDKDKQTKEGIAILDKEYEIFRDPNMPGVKVLTRYDTWEEDRSIE